MPDQWGSIRIGPRLLAAGAPAGPLAGTAFAVKDLIDVAGWVTGGGNPAHAAEASPASVSAAAVDALVRAGASCVAKTHTDEFAFGLSGINGHYGAPVNPAFPDRITGGSSSGSAAAVAAGLVAFALGTDTGGSVRVPASYCGVLGFRPTHGAVSLAGALPLAPSFDTLGWFTRDAGLAALIGDVLLEAAPPGTAATGSSDAGSADTDNAAAPPAILLADEVLNRLDEPLARKLRAAAAQLASTLGSEVRPVSLGAPLTEWLGVFRTIQTREAFDAWGGWIAAHPGAVSADVAERFAAGAHVTDTQLQTARQRRTELTAPLRGLLDTGAILLLPSASGPAPLREPLLAGDADARSANDAVRSSTMELTSIAGLAGAPVLAVPALTMDGAPVGLSLVGAPGSDRALLRLAPLLPSGWLPVPEDRDTAELRLAFSRYEEALVGNDVETLIELFSTGADTIRLGPADAAYGSDDISAFRRSRPPGDLERDLDHIVVRTIAPGAGVAVAEYARVSNGRRGRQTQTWVREADGWKVVLAHVSLLA